MNKQLSNDDNFKNMKEPTITNLNKQSSNILLKNISPANWTNSLNSSSFE